LDFINHILPTCIAVFCHFKLTVFAVLAIDNNKFYFSCFANGWTSCERDKGMPSFVVPNELLFSLLPLGV